MLAAVELVNWDLAMARRSASRTPTAGSTPDRTRQSLPGELEKVLARARAERWTQLALLGPDAAPYADWLRGQGWPAERIFQLKERLGAEGARALAALTNLTSLNLGSNGIGAEGARALAALTNLTSLETQLQLDRGRGCARPSGADQPHLARSRGKRHRERGRMRPGGADQPDLALFREQRHRELGRARSGGADQPDLARPQLPTPSGHEGARALAALTNLTWLDLGSNGIGTDGARALAALTKLTWLGLGSNGIGAEGARALAALTNLTSLDLREQRHRKRGARDAGARALAALTKLTSLDSYLQQHRGRGRARPGGADQPHFARSWGNRIGDEGARALAALTNLTSLDLCDNGIGDEGARALLDAWVEAPTAGRLRHLDLQGQRRSRVRCCRPRCFGHDAMPRRSWRPVAGSAPRRRADVTPSQRSEAAGGRQRGGRQDLAGPLSGQGRAARSERGQDARHRDPREDRDPDLVARGQPP